MTVCLCNFVSPFSTLTVQCQWVNSAFGLQIRCANYLLIKASNEEVILNAPHQPHPNSLEAFGHVLHDIKHAIIHSRRDWDKHEPKMWSRASGISDQELVDFTLEVRLKAQRLMSLLIVPADCTIYLQKDLVVVRSAPVSYGTVILGKIRIPAIDDDEGEGFIHVRCVATSEKMLHMYYAKHIDGLRIHDPPNRVSFSFQM